MAKLSASNKTQIAKSLRAAAKALAKFDLEHHPLLERLALGKPTLLFHGTTADFKTFDPKKSRHELVKNYYGSGIFLTPSKKVAGKYAQANRNIGLPVSIIDDLKRVNAPAAKFLRSLHKNGNKAWDELLGKHMTGPNDTLDHDSLAKYLGADSNDIFEISEWIIGSKTTDIKSRGPVMFFNPGPTGMPDYVYTTLDQVGLDSSKYRPKVYMVKVLAKNLLVTASKAEAKAAKRNGYDAVVYHGKDLVDGVPEVAVFDPRRVKIMRVEVGS